MGWLLLVVLGIMWATFLHPIWRFSPTRSVEDFERNMDLLADTEGNAHGRWIVTPRKGVAFVGARERAKERGRERRRRVFVFMLESIGLTALIGLVPPLRAMWYATAVLLVVLGVYVWLLLSTKSKSARARRLAANAPHTVRGDVSRTAPARSVQRRYAADAGSRTPRPDLGGLAVLEADDLANIVVKRAGRPVGVAGA
jgi:hypothetical protein